MFRLFLALLLTLIPVAEGWAAETIRVGTLKFGTVNWELDTIKKNGLDAKYGIDLEIIPFAGEDASSIALQAGAVDMTVSDWLFVSRQRSSGDDLAFVPYSSSVGAIMVSPNSSIESLADITKKKIGVAGGPLDKNWLLIQAWAKRDGLDLAAANEVVYGAPPLLAEKLRQGELDAVLNYWQFNARLQAEGYRQVVSAQDAANALGASGPVSAIGYVFHEAWAKQHKDAVLGFVRASRDAKALLKNSDEQWQRLHADGLIQDEGKSLEALRENYRKGIPFRPIAEEEGDAAKLYRVLAALGGEKLVGSAKAMAPGTYWVELKHGL